jgi:hypothetical protein
LRKYFFGFEQVIDFVLAHQGQACVLQA